MDPRYSQYPGSSSHGYDPVRDSQRLHSMYPPASGTPTAHVARHLSSLTIAANPPSYAQPSYYSGNGHHYADGAYAHPYAAEVNHLAASQLNTDDGGYWRDARNDAIRLLGDQPNSHHTTHNWPRSNGYNGGQQSNAFAQSVFQHTAPASHYPTPPPGMSSSSSSLANALGNPPPRNAYTPQQSTAFFNNFVNTTKQKMEVAAPARPVAASMNRPPPVNGFPAERSRATLPSTPFSQHTRPPIPNFSPDPLALAPSTPRKRKSEDVLQSPSLKKVSASGSSSSSVLSQASSSLSTPTASRIRMQPYIELPTLKKTPSYMTPSSLPKPPRASALAEPPSTPTQQRSAAKTALKMDADGDDDLGGYGEVTPPRKPMSRVEVVITTSRRTGERDERRAVDKLVALLEDIAEAEDALPPDAAADDLPPQWFSAHSPDAGAPLLAPDVVRRLTKGVGQVARPSKRVRLAEGGHGTPRQKGTLGDVDAVLLGRVLKMLERSVKAGEDLEPIPPAPLDRKGGSPVKKKAAAKKKGARREKSKTPGDEEAEEEAEDVKEETRREVTHADFEKLARDLDLARDSVLAADCCLAILSSGRLSKQLYSEELITACLATVKNQLTKLVYPFVEASFDSPAPPAGSLLHHLVKSPAAASQAHRRQLAEAFQAVSAALPRVNALVSTAAIALSEALVIQAVYIAIGPFFVADGGDGEKMKKDNAVLSTLGASAMRGLRLDALSLLRSIFANHEDQRSWIIEEILGSLVKLSDNKQKAGQFRLRDGRSIKTVSALLLQLVQTSAHDVRVLARKLGKSRVQQQALRRHESINASTPGSAKDDEQFLDDTDREEIRLYMSGLESATKAAKTIVVFLTQRSGKGKATKNTNEAEYRAIFDNLISDLVTVLFWPEWPAASILLGVACKSMVFSLDDVKSISQNDSNAARSIALDHLGMIASKIRTSILHFRSADDKTEDTARRGTLTAMDETLGARDIKGFVVLAEAHADISAHLCKRSSEDQACESARELTAAIWGQELAQALKQINKAISGDDDDIEPLTSREKDVAFGAKLKTTLRNVWKDPTVDVFDVGSQEEVARIDRIAEEIGTLQSLKNSFHPMLNAILSALDAPPVFMRTKALRALGQIVTSDPAILATTNVRAAIESHMLDSSPAVRDAAVELIGKYMIDSPEVAGDYYQKIAERMADTGLGVRKRVIKLLKSFYTVTDQTERRTDICQRLVLRMYDEDDTVKDLAVKTLEELWFADGGSTAASKGKQVTRDKAQLLAKVSVIMAVAGHFKDRQSPLEDMLHKIMVGKSGSEAGALHARYTEICETLIDGLVDASDLPDFTVINCVRTIYLFTSAYPAALSGSNASTLLPYLKNASTAEEQVTSEYLLKIFRASIPNLPKTAAKFGQELQVALQPMVIKPSAGVQGLQETVACMCAVVQSLTHEYKGLVVLMKSCNGKLQQALSKPATQQMTPLELRALSILIFIVSLLAEHCDFERVRVEHTEHATQLDTVSQGPIIEHVYFCLLKLYERQQDQGLRKRVLQCLGFLFRAQPVLMTHHTSADVMDAIFNGDDEEARAQLLLIMQDFLLSQASKNTSKERGQELTKGVNGGVDMDQLVGNTGDFAESGVSSAIVQRYMGPILQAALSQNTQIQTPAVEILSFTIKQGLAHPMQSFPVIVALETSSNSSLSARANALHASLNIKHASLINARYVTTAKESFAFQKRMAPGQIQGYRIQHGPIALLQPWYSHVREKRATRQDFLRALVKVFDVDSSFTATQDDLDFTRYMAENFSAFDYKTQEEVLTVIKSLTALLSTVGMQLVEVLSPSNLLAQLHSRPDAEGDVPMADTGANDPQDPLDAKPADQKLALMRSSVIVAMIMLLKAHLKVLYGISEDKCSKWVMGKKSAVGDRPATKKNDKPLLWQRLPYAQAQISTDQDARVQRSTFLEIWNEDGVTAEPEDEPIVM